MKASLALLLGAFATFCLNLAHGVDLRSALNIKTVKRNHEPGFHVKETENKKLIQGDYKQGKKIQSDLAGRKKSMDWMEDFFGNGTTDFTMWQDSDSCYNQSFTDCDTCTATALSNASESCIWSYEYGLCEYWLGYGDPTCDDSSVTDYYWCGGCLESGGVWSSYQCLESCDDATSICYSADTSPGSSTSEICEVALNDELSCYAYELTDCESCNSVTLSDGSSCSWYSMPFVGGFCDAASSLAYDLATASTTCEENDTGIIDFLLDEINNFDLDGFINDTGILDIFDLEELVNDTSILDFFYGDTFYENFDWESWESCANQSFTDCDTCSGTVLSDATEGCTWSDQWGSCDYLSEPASCEEASNVTEIYWCGGCLDNDGAWTGMECLESCDASTSICYSVATSPNLSSAEICEVALNDRMACWEHDWGDCESCTNTELSDGSTCSWYPARGWCEPQTSLRNRFNGYEFAPSTSCDEPVDISYIHWCPGCVDNGGSWLPFYNDCVESCTDTDALCYSTETHVGMDTAQICESVDEDTMTCFTPDATDCDTCTSIVLSDGSSVCGWSEYWGYCDSVGSTTTCDP